jgi:ATP-binding cassette subfamily F protein 2
MPPKVHRPKGKKKRLAAQRKAEEMLARDKAEAAAAAGGDASDAADAAAASAEGDAAAAAGADASSAKDVDASTAAGSSTAASGAGTSSAKGVEADVAAAALESAAEAAAAATEAEDEMVGESQHRKLMDEAIAQLSITFAPQTKSVHENSRDIKVEGLNMTLGKKELIKDATLSLNWGNRYGLVGANGCGKSLLMTAIGRRLVPIPESLDIYHVVSEVEASDMKALEAVLAVDSEKKALEAEAEALSNAMEHMSDMDEATTEIMSERIADIYDHLDLLEADTAEARAASILHGLGFTTEMQTQRCRDFSGGWRMRISLARALFLDSSILLLDGEPCMQIVLACQVARVPGCSRARLLAR